MKRKIIQIAKSTVMVSIPSKFVKKYGITKGDEVDVKEAGSQIVIETKKPDISKKIYVDATIVKDRVLRYLLSGAHKSGYVEIEIKYNSKEQLDTTNDLLKNLYTGFAMMEQKANKLVLKKISKDIEEEFNPSLRRAFLVTISLSESILEHINKNQFENILDLINLEKTNNQLTNFCERVLNEGFYDCIKTTFTYTIIWNLEKIADEYKHICETLNLYDNKISKDIIALLEEANKLLKGYYDLFYDFKLEKVNDLDTTKKKIDNLYLEATKNKNPKEQKILHHIITIVHKCSDFSTNIVGLNLENKQSQY